MAETAGNIIMVFVSNIFVTQDDLFFETAPFNKNIMDEQGSS